jgi:hypothetical protein
MTRSHNVTILLMLAAALLLPAAVCSAQTRAEKGPGYGLWVLNEFYVSEFQSKALVRDGAPRARLAFGLRSLDMPLGIAFDGSQNLWLSFDAPSMGEIIRLTPRQVQALASGHEVKRTLLLQNKQSYYPFNDPTTIRFDNDGDLWVMDSAISSIMEFTPDQLIASGDPTPSVWIRAGLFVAPWKMRFDSLDNLWVDWPGIGQASQVHEFCRFSPADRSASGPPTPGLIVDMPASLAVDDFGFDSQGNLWISEPAAEPPQALHMVPVDNLVGSGEIFAAPTISINLTQLGAVGCPDDEVLDFDPNGSLWVAGSPANSGCSQGDQVLEFSADSLTASGSITSSVGIHANRRHTNIWAPNQILFGPSIH